MALINDVIGDDKTELDENSQPKIAKRTVENNETVQGQLTNILSKDSRLQQDARTRARQASAGRGLINSSIAAGAGERAVIREALPIAQQDAKTYSDAASANQGYENKSRENFQNFTNQNELANQEHGRVIERMDRDTFNKLTMAEQENEYKRSFAELESGLKTNEIWAQGKAQAYIEEVKADATFTQSQKQTFAQEVSRIMSTSQDQIGQVGASGATKDQQQWAVNQIIAQRDSQISALKSLMLASGSWNW